jgi:uncharacterized phage protein (predicted DNA packaging)
MSIISVDVSKAHMNVVGTDDDTLIASKIEAAEAWIDRWLSEPMADMEEVPADLKQAVLMLAAHFYENREATLVGLSAEDVPLGVWDILTQHREWSF